jgi:hypothetical protein
MIDGQPSQTELNDSEQKSAPKKLIDSDDLPICRILNLTFTVENWSLLEKRAKEILGSDVPPEVYVAEAIRRFHELLKENELLWLKLEELGAA